ncbi:flagellar motor switch protein FliG [Nitrosococcus halophilus Nc 4]|uniref:Flagellar motor switch protein FliG n=1 Tax=Nitrosococcus halophilus (strain Nc4) TaxID=472759 RepID=D5BV84_NITHN|nr:flagellar motor switch protein FliG [Nitrosococcus halophilus]ADE15434.1 flagellar motor switch protein FliG [Nitrosococcus halophilus Nc 4]
MAEGQLSGTERAAILLRSLGEQGAAKVLKHLEPKEIQKIGTTMATLRSVSREQVDAVLQDFAERIREETALGIGSDDYVRTMLQSALGEDKAGTLIDRILLGGNTNGIEQLKWMDARSIYQVIHLEHPQVIAIVLSFLESEQAAEVLSLFAAQVRLDIVLRIATLERVQPSALDELNGILEEQFSGTHSSLKASSVGGVKTAANILNLLDSAVENEVLEQIKEADAELGQNIEDLMFVFDNLLEVDDRGIRSLLREVSSETLIIALKGAAEELKQKIFKNMSKRAGEMLREDLESKGPVRLSEVEAAQKEIIAMARRLAKAGDISLGGGGDEYI